MAESHDHSLLDLDTVTASLGKLARCFDVAAVAVCDSTNTQMLARAEAGDASGSVLVADRQTAGRGRRGRVWHSAPGDSLTFSLLWRFKPESGAPAALSLAVGLAVARALESLGAQGVSLKWPNDVLHDGRKLGGILVELQSGNLRSAVIGIGLNLQMPDDLPDDLAATATALDALIKQPSRETVLAALLTSLKQTLDTYGTAGFTVLRDEWLARHAYQDRLVYIEGDGAALQGKCIGIDAEGALLLTTGDGVSRVIAGEVSLRPGARTAP